MERLWWVPGIYPGQTKTKRKQNSAERSGTAWEGRGREGEKPSGGWGQLQRQED